MMQINTRDFSLKNLIINSLAKLRKEDFYRDTFILLIASSNGLSSRRHRNSILYIIMTLIYAMHLCSH